MIIITGTPGTGKTSVAEELAKLTKRSVVHLNDYIKKNLDIEYDPAYESYSVDTKLLEDLDFGDAIVEGHLAHFIKRSEMTVVLRCDPRELAKRLENRGWSERKIAENVVAEILDVISAEANGMDVDTTNTTPVECAKKIMNGHPDEVDWMKKYSSCLSPNDVETLKKIKSNKC